MRTTAAWSDGVLVLDSKTALTVDDGEHVLVFDEQSDAAGEPLRNPDETAAAEFKNVLLLKDMPKSITITHGINDQNLGGYEEVRCFTCHPGKPEPQSRPSFQ